MKRATITSTTGSESEAYIRKYIRDHKSGVLGTSDRAAHPYVAAVYYTVIDDLSIMFATKRETQKVTNIQANPSVAFAIYDEVEQSSVQITGEAEEVNNVEMKRDAARAMFQKSSDISKREFSPAEKLDAGDLMVFRLVPRVIKMAVFARPLASEEYYETLLFDVA